jgi:hypothetical protein
MTADTQNGKGWTPDDRRVGVTISLPHDLWEQIIRDGGSVQARVVARLRQSFAEDRVYAALERIEAKLAPQKQFVPRDPFAILGPANRQHAPIEDDGA